MSAFDPSAWIASRLAGARREFEWHDGVDDTWVATLRRRLAAVTGFDRLKSGHLEPVIGSVEVRDGLRRSEVSFTSQPGLRVAGTLILPEELDSPRPAVVCLPGHGPGKAPIVDDSMPDYQNAFALQFAQAGFVVLAVEQFSFGLRQSKPSPDRPYSCSPDSMAALSLGETMVAWRCWDALAGRDFLASLPEVDAARIVTAGISGGGATAFWSACLDTRLAGCVVSGYFNTFAASIHSVDHCVDNYVPDLALVVEMPDMAALVAPRLFFAESGTEDPIFPRVAFESACARAREVYGRQTGNFGSHLFEGDHHWDGSQAVPWLAARLCVAECS
jgi:dienelactone hydrolase